MAQNLNLFDDSQTDRTTLKGNQKMTRTYLITEKVMYNSYSDPDQDQGLSGTQA